MPGLINIRPPSASDAKLGERTDLSKAFAERSDRSKAFAASDTVPEVAPLPSLLLGRAARMFPVPASEMVRLQAPPRPKQVTDPLAEVVRARLCGDDIPDRMIPNYSSSGSEHDPSSVCLAAMVNEFMENETNFGHCGRARCNCWQGNCGGDRCSSSNFRDTGIEGEISSALQGLVRCASKKESTLLADVAQVVSLISAAICSMSSEEVNAQSSLKRVVMKRLRRLGYNAAICKSRWGYSGGIPAGDYEYIDVLDEVPYTKNERFIVDIDFRCQFEIARPTAGYTAVWQLLPPIFVGKPERLQQIVYVMSEAAKQSLEVKGLHVPPWRKPNYLKAKWFSSYKRTSNDQTHTSKEGEVFGREFAGIALRGAGLDVRCTKEMEILYHEAGSGYLSRDCAGKREATADGKGHGKREAPEGAVRSTTRSRSERDEITVVATDWQPPAVVPRSTSKPGKVTGLSSVLLQAGLAKPRHSALKQEEGLARAA